MKITKFGHSCLLVEEAGVRIITDPGVWNPTPDVDGVDAILITHEHQDHCDVEQIKALLSKNTARVITHEAVGKVLSAAGITVETIEPGQSLDVRGVSIQSFGTEHAVIYGTSPCRNAGYFIGGALYVPGDALHDLPGVPVAMLALPTGGPWMKLADAIDYAKKVKPALVFPIHDAMYIDEFVRTTVPRWVGETLVADGIEFHDLAPGGVIER